MISSSEIDRIAGDCIRLGIKRLKTVDIELELDLERGHTERGATNLPVIPDSATFKPLPKYGSTPAMDTEATEKLKGLIETLKMPDEQLLDTIFPAGAGG